MSLPPPNSPSNVHLSVANRESRRLERAHRVREMRAFFTRHQAVCGCDGSSYDDCKLPPPFCLDCIALLETPHAELPPCCP